MNLVIDVGNSFIKSGTFLNGELVDIKAFLSQDEFVENFNSEKYAAIKNVIVSSTQKLNVSFENILTQPPKYLCGIGMLQKKH